MPNRSSSVYSLALLAITPEKTGARVKEDEQVTEDKPSVDDREVA